MTKPVLPEPSGIIVVGTQALRAFTAEQMLAFRAEGMATLEAEIERLHGVVRKVNDRCDHLGIRLGEVIRERDALLAAIAQDGTKRSDAG